MARFKDRSEAGRRLAELFSPKNQEPPVVLALLRGGVPVAAPIARKLGAFLDVLAVKKIGVPSNPEVALGAVTDQGPAFWNEKLVASMNIDETTRTKWEISKRAEAKRQIDFFRGKTPEIPLADRDVIVVDDGLATGATLELALRELKRRGVSKITIAVPVAASGSVRRLREEAEKVIALSTPKNFKSVGEFYEDFSQVSNEEALEILEKSQPQDGYESEIERLARPLDRDFQLGVLAEHIASARLVVLGHAVSGTRELESLRRKLSQILIQDHGFNLIALDADPSVAQDLNKMVRSGRAVAPHELISKFSHWPRWLYANEETPSLIEPMHKYKAEFFGLDVHSFFQSMSETRKLIREGRSPREIVARLGSLLDARLIRMGLGSPELFDIKHNSRLIEGSARYFERLLEDRPERHVLRDRHLLEALQVLVKSKGPRAKVIVWTHDLHADSRSNLGKLLRDEFGEDQVCLIGMTAGHGARLASEDWGETEIEAPWNEPRADDLESRMHAVARKKNWKQLGFVFDMKSRQGDLSTPRPQRLASVVEGAPLKDENRVVTALSRCYDAFIYVDRCSPLQARTPRQLAFGRVLTKHVNRKIKPEDRPSQAK